MAKKRSTSSGRSGGSIPIQPYALIKRIRVKTQLKAQPECQQGQLDHAQPPGVDCWGCAGTAALCRAYELATCSRHTGPCIPVRCPR